jgi:hypothetical protein
VDRTGTTVLDRALGIKNILLTKALADPARSLLDLVFLGVCDDCCSVTVSIESPVSVPFELVCYLVVACGSDSVYALRKIVSGNLLRSSSGNRDKDYHGLPTRTDQRPDIRPLSWKRLYNPVSTLMLGTLPESSCTTTGF